MRGRANQASQGLGSQPTWANTALTLAVCAMPPIQNLLASLLGVLMTNSRVAGSYWAVVSMPITFDPWPSSCGGQKGNHGGHGETRLGRLVAPCAAPRPRQRAAQRKRPVPGWAAGGGRVPGRLPHRHGKAAGQLQRVHLAQDAAGRACCVAL